MLCCVLLCTAVQQSSADAQHIGAVDRDVGTLGRAASAVLCDRHCTAVQQGMAGALHTGLQVGLEQALRCGVNAVLCSDM